jgi:alpha-ribazole phosphatase
VPELALIRHTRANIADGVCYGSTDVAALPFDAEFSRIVEEITAWRPERIISSDLRRCRVLADTLSAATGARQEIDARLRELDFGDWEGMRWDDLPRDALDRWAADPLGFAAPRGESGAALIARVTACFADISEFQGRQAIVSHAGPLRVLMALAGGVTVDLLRPGPALGSVFFVPPRGQGDASPSE